MNILLISQCDKRALAETRRILDQFAERRGDRTWQTPITQDGLDALRKLLRKTARKNTAVACHWIRGLDHSELLWIVGDRSRFNVQGAVPTNTTRRNVLRGQDENDWHTGELICLLADLAGLLHDLGKAIAAFQHRLTHPTLERNLLRHEWVSLRMFEAFVGGDDDAAWLARLANPTAQDDARWRHPRRDGLDDLLGFPFANLANAPLAQAVGWLVVTHHRLPVLPLGNDAGLQSILPGLLTQIGPDWNEWAFADARSDRRALTPYWQLPDELPVSAPEWRQRAARIARRLQALAAQEAPAALSNPYVMHLSRLCLMLADHHYSSLEAPAQRVKVALRTGLWANTRTSDRQPNQSLEEHLVGVAQHAAEVARFLPRFEFHLPRLGHHRKLRQRSQTDRFRWQDKAADVAASMRTRSQEHGAFIVNMASTGCGKTLANARVMHALAEPATGMRCAFALGLRTLTLQTGQAFRQRLGLSDDDLAILVGGAASRALFEHHEAQAESTGSASRLALLEEASYVAFDGNVQEHPLLRRAVADPAVRQLLEAPLLVCTIDHLTPATESQRGGRQIAPMLRLMSGDLVLDEPDDFDLSDLPALTRLVHWAGLLGSRVLLSSATLPPALVQGLFEAYRNGRQHFQRNRGHRPGAGAAPPAICCAWIDEFGQRQADCQEPAAFEQAHRQFVGKRCEALARMAATPRRKAIIQLLEGLPSSLKGAAEVFAGRVLDAVHRLHQDHHSVDPRTGRRVSFGLVRMANIDPLIETALALFRQGAPEGLQIHLCVYHARHPLLVRSAIERQLDAALQRHDPDAVFDHADIRHRIDAHPSEDHAFIVLGSPVTEVGRDHCYDWAVVEPSSMRSLIQLAGRIRRHRLGIVNTPNVVVFSTNLRHFLRPGRAAFCRPGFETDQEVFHLHSHDLRQLLDPDELVALDARPRILARPVDQWQPRDRLVDLEHARLRDLLLESTRPAAAAPASGPRARRGVASALPMAPATLWWRLPPQDALLTAVIPQRQRFRDAAGQQEIELVLLPDDDGEDFQLHRVMESAKSRGTAWPYEPADQQLVRISAADVLGPRIEPWGVVNYMTALQALAEEHNLSVKGCALKFGRVKVRDDKDRVVRWRYHPVLGISEMHQ